MTTSLSRQLQKLAAPQTSLLDHRKKKASILFTEAEAATHTRDTFYEIGLAGFSELVEVNEQFNKFKENLFGLKVKELQRVVESAEVNKQLDKVIEEFLYLLSPYLQKQSALKSLEWLLHRFLINEMNINALVMCIFPYYETILFVRILQLVDIKSDQSPWNWLYQSQCKGRPIPKQTVYLHWSSNQWFRNILAQYFRKMLKVHDKEQNLQFAASLLISTQIGGMESADKITENHISSIYQTLQLCLKSSNAEILSGTLLMISQLSISVTLSKHIVEEMFLLLLQISNPSMCKQIAICFLTIFYHQNVEEISPALMECLESNDELITQITKFSSQKPICCFMAPFIRQSVIRTLADETKSETKRIRKIQSLVELIQMMPMLPVESSKVIRNFLHGISESKLKLMAFQHKINLVAMLKELEASHPEGFDVACANITKASALSGSQKFDFEVKLIQSFKEKWSIQPKRLPFTEKIKKKEKSVSTLEERWLECFKSGKFSVAAVKFLLKISSNLHLSETEKASPFWQLSGDSDFSSALKTMIKILNVVIVHQIKNKNRNICDQLLKKLFTDILGSTKSQIYFLASIFGWNEEEEDVGINKYMKLWALNMTSSLVNNAATGSESLSWVFDPKEPLVASLILPVCEGDVLALGAFKVMEAMISVAGIGLRPSSLSVLIEGVIEKKEEITTDVSYLPLVISCLVAEKKSAGQKLVGNLLGCVLDPKVPRHIKSSVLYAISQVNNAEIFSQLIPLANSLLDEAKEVSEGDTMSCSSSTCLYYVLLRFTAADLAFLEIKGGWELLRRSLDFSAPVLKVSGEQLSPQELVANYKLLLRLSNSNRLLEVLEIFLSRIVRTNSSHEASKLNRELKKVSLKASQIISLWNDYNLIPSIISVREARAKRLKDQKNPNGDSNTESWRKFGYLIELVGVIADLKQPWLLIGPICDHMQALVKVESSLADTLQQKMLSVCYHLLQMSANLLTKEEFIKNCKLNVALIVQSIRTSVNPDTHRRALLILALASNYFPDQVLHNIMAIFTFMGTSLLLRDDSYSFHVIHLTISSIVPALIQAESSDPKLLLKKLSEVTQVFVDALPDLAEHRRLPLFKQLATTLGVSRYLWLVMVLIADAYVTHGTTAEEDATEGDPRRLPRNIHFALVLYRQFSVTDQMKASCEVVNFISNLPDEKESLKGNETKRQNSSTLVINVETRSSRQLRQLKYTCAGLLVHLLSSEKFIDQVHDFYTLKTVGDLEELTELYKVILEKSLQYLKVVSAQEELHNGNPSGRFWSAMQRKLISLVDAINSLLPPMLLIEVVSNLMRSTSSLIRCRAMEILASKLQPDVKFFSSNQEVKSLVDFIDPLRKVGLDTKEPENNRQTALFTLQLLLKRINSRVDPEVILPVLESTVTLIDQGDPSTKVVTQAALVVAETIHVLKVHSLVHLDKLVPALLSILKKSLKQESLHSDNLVIATATALNKVAENVPRLLSGKDLKSLITISCRLIAKQEEEGLKDSRLTARLSGTLEQLVHSVEFRVLIPVLTETYTKMSEKGLSCLPSIMSIIESLIEFVKTSSLVRFKQDFISLFIVALDVRSSRVDDDPEAIERVEGCVNSALTRFLLRLNEDDNITIFSMLLKWAWNNSEEKPARLITFFRFADQLANNLKVLFIKAKLAAKVFDYAIPILEKNNNMLNEDTIFGRGEEAEKLTSVLLKYVLGMFTKIFTYDSVQFINREKFNIIVEPLTNQIENTLGSENDFKTRISDLKTCIIMFTKAIGDDSLWKELNRQILLRIRSDNDSKVILAGLEIFEGLVEALGEDYLQPLLADTIPYITEILESFDANVETKAKNVFNKMETILGDSLRAYLDT